MYRNQCQFLSIETIYRSISIFRFSGVNLKRSRVREIKFKNKIRMFFVLVILVRKLHIPEVSIHNIHVEQGKNYKLFSHKTLYNFMSSQYITIRVQSNHWYHLKLHSKPYQKMTKNIGCRGVHRSNLQLFTSYSDRQ